MIKRLPDAEFEVMKAIWAKAPPVTTLEVMNGLKNGKNWKPQAVLTMLVRLIEKGFLTSEREGRMRNYTPMIAEQEYMKIETGGFMKRYNVNSVGNLVKMLCSDQDISQEDLRELKNWLETKGSG